MVFLLRLGQNPFGIMVYFFCNRFLPNIFRCSHDEVRFFILFFDHFSKQLLFLCKQIENIRKHDTYPRHLFHIFFVLHLNCFTFSFVWLGAMDTSMDLCTLHSLCVPCFMYSLYILFVGTLYLFHIFICYSAVCLPCSICRIS